MSTIPPHWPCKRPTAFYGALVPPVGLEPTRSHERHILSVVCLPIPPRRQKKKGSENKHEQQQPRDHSAPNQRDTRTPAAPSASPTRVRGHSQPAHPDRPQLTHQHREHPGANTQSPPAHTQRTTNAATHPCVTAPAAASTPALFPLPGRRSRT